MRRIAGEERAVDRPPRRDARVNPVDNCPPDHAPGIGPVPCQQLLDGVGAQDILLPFVRVQLELEPPGPIRSRKREAEIRSSSRPVFQLSPPASTRSGAWRRRLQRISQAATRVSTFLRGSRVPR